MLATIVLVLGGFALVLLRACRKRPGASFAPEGKLRWSDEPPSG
jgi:hypothetical protein